MVFERTWNDGYDEEGMPVWLTDFGYTPCGRI